jgi:energy-coupling factor transporter ATP-binding protein EcfA2
VARTVALGLPSSYHSPKLSHWALLRNGTAYMPPTPRPAPPVITIEIGENQGRYKSIERLTWANIPPFAVLTGINGSGKSQLLELLANKLSGLNIAATNTISCTVTGDTFDGDSVVFVGGSQPLQDAGAGVENLRQSRQQAAQLAARNHIVGDIENHARQTAMRALLQRKGVQTHLPVHELSNFLPEDLSFMISEFNVVHGLVHVFEAYRLGFAEKRERDIPKEEIFKEMGRPPWEILNQALSLADFGYQIVSPTETRIQDQFQIRFRKPGSSIAIEPPNLSSGEQSIVKLLAWLFGTETYGKTPKIYLLDEPDAHLHPSLTKQFMSVLVDSLVNKFGIRVILSTHSPSTVALAPEGSVFEMWKDAPRIRPSASVAHTVGLLTSGLMVVSKATKFVLVEDENDVDFFESLWDILTDRGPSKIPGRLEPVPSVVFRPAATGRGPARIGGGCTVVRLQVEKFDQEPLKGLFRGVTDLDAGNVGTDRIKVIGRYSIENYLLDPIVVYAALLEADKAPAVSGITVKKGSEHELGALPQSDLQRIADEVLGLVDRALRAGGVASATPTREVEFTNGIKVRYFEWMFTYRGHDLLAKFQYALDSSRAQTIQYEKLNLALRRVRLIPKELAQVMRELQA